MRLRLLFLLFTITWLFIASFNSATAYFAMALRDCARSDYTRSKHPILPISFESTITNVLDLMIIVAVPSALLSVLGIVSMAHPRLSNERSAFTIYFGGIQLILSLAILSVGGYIANSIHGYQTLFEEFEHCASHFPYYSMMYYGGVGQAVYGTLVIILTLVYVIV